MLGFALMPSPSASESDASTDVESFAASGGFSAFVDFHADEIARGDEQQQADGFCQNEPRFLIGVEYETTKVRNMRTCSKSGHFTPSYKEPGREGFCFASFALGVSA